MTLLHQMSYKLPSPIELLGGADFGFHLEVKREDLIHPKINGNKFRKLKYNYEYFIENNYKGIITYGGAYSNHLHAVASLGNLYGIPTIGIIRGEEFEDNDILNYCKSAGMLLHKVSRSAYKEKENHTEIESIIVQYPNFLIIPEGGSNALALQGIMELVDELPKCYDLIAVAAGTGCTAAGIIKRIDELKLPTRVIVFSALKGAWMKGEIENILCYEFNRHMVTDSYCMGGYARLPDAYIKQLKEWRTSLQIPIDPIYNGKLLIGLKDLANQGKIKKHDQVLWINSGGVI